MTQPLLSPSREYVPVTGRRHHQRLQREPVRPARPEHDPRAPGAVEAEHLHLTTADRRHLLGPLDVLKATNGTLKHAVFAEAREAASTATARAACPIARHRSRFIPAPSPSPPNKRPTTTIEGLTLNTAKTRLIEGLTLNRAKTRLIKGLTLNGAKNWLIEGQTLKGVRNWPGRL
jgi:hypothetical protein